MKPLLIQVDQDLYDKFRAALARPFQAFLAPGRLADSDVVEAKEKARQESQTDALATIETFVRIGMEEQIRADVAQPEKGIVIPVAPVEEPEVSIPVGVLSTQSFGKEEKPAKPRRKAAKRKKATKKKSGPKK